MNFKIDIYFSITTSIYFPDVFQATSWFHPPIIFLSKLFIIDVQGIGIIILAIFPHK